MRALVPAAISFTVMNKHYGGGHGGVISATPHPNPLPMQHGASSFRQRCDKIFYFFFKKHEFCGRAQKKKRFFFGKKNQKTSIR
jgi:hypothetical protein